jgi:hypothetical protein
MKFTPRPLYHRKIKPATFRKETVSGSSEEHKNLFPNEIRTSDHPACGLFAIPTSTEINTLLFIALSKQFQNSYPKCLRITIILLVVCMGVKLGLSK